LLLRFTALTIFTRAGRGPRSELVVSGISGQLLRQESTSTSQFLDVSAVALKHNGPALIHLLTESQDI
jgi:hypothetical protein